jgi:hypothetical protein
MANAVAPALLSETAKIAEVLSDLGRGHLQLFPQLLGVDHLGAFLEQTA